MKVDIDRLTKFLNSTAKEIKDAADVVQDDPAKALQYIPNFTQKIEQLRSLGNLSDVSASIVNSQEKDSVHAAIQTFLQNVKEAQEKVGVVGAAIFGMPEFRDFTANLEQVKASLEKGKRVEAPEEEQGI